MREKIARVGVRRQEGYLYFIDKQGDVSRARMARVGKKRKKAKAKKIVKVAKVGVRKAPGYLYFIDKHGDVSRVKMARKARRVL